VNSIKTDSVIDGYTDPSSAYSSRTVFKKLPLLTRPIIAYDPVSTWEYDTQRLPRPLRKLRRRLRQFADRELCPIAKEMDMAPHRAAGTIPPKQEQLLKVAAAEGLLTDIFPIPFGSVPISQYFYSLAWQQAIKTEELSRACGGLMLALCAHNLGIAPILLSGDIGAIRRFILPAFKETKQGSPHLFAYAITEPNAGSDVEESHGARLYKPGVVARRTQGGWLLKGRKCFISGGDIAKSISVFAALEGEAIDSWTCFLVHAGMPGFSVARTELKMGMRASGAAELEFDDVFVPDIQVVGGLRNGWAINRATLNLSRIPVAAMAVGFAQGATEIATDFACSYRLAGKSLIHYQEIQLMIAQMIADTTAIRSLVWQSARAWRATQQKSAISKFYCTDVAVNVCEQAMELLGNHGTLMKQGAEKMFRDARLTQIFEGTNQINRLAVIEDIQEQLLRKVNHS